MKLFVGVTDTEWYSFLKKEQADEVNFWQPSGGVGFKALPMGGPFLFKLKAPYNAIAGIGWFASYSVLPLSVAWHYFGRKNGVASFGELQQKIVGYRKDNQPNPQIGCIGLTDPVFFKREDWLTVPKSWSKNIVRGKGYATDTPDGKRLWEQVQDLLARYRWLERPVEEKAQLVSDSASPEYREVLSKVRVGQSNFRALVTNAYQKKCAISGEKTLPVLEASHIKPYALSGPHRTANGLLLRSDLHTLFDTGYLTITTDHRVEVSRRIREEFENGREYYQFQGSRLLILPESMQDQPDPSYLNWHNEQIYRG